MFCASFQEKSKTMTKKLALLLFLFTICSHSQNTLDKAKKSVNSSKSEQSSSSSSKNSKPTNRSALSSNDNEGNIFESLLSEIFVSLVYGTIKSTFIASPWEGKHYDSWLSKYPYYEQKKGGFNYDENENYKLSRFLISNAYIKTNERIQGNYFKTEFQFARRFSLEGDFLYLSENNFVDSKTNYLHYTLLANYYRIKSEKFSLWYGLGVRYTGSGIHKTGVAYAIGFRSYITKPFSIETSFKGARINNTNINHFNSQLNYHYLNKNFSLGYTNFKIGSEDFGGLSVGIGIYL